MVCYEFYRTTYRGGSISAEDWPGYEARAEAQVAFYERTYTVGYPGPESRQKAVCALAEAMRCELRNRCLPRRTGPGAVSDGQALPGHLSGVG